MRSLLAEPGRVVRVALPLLVVLFSLSGIWRFEAGALGAVSSAAWAAFGATLLVTVAFGVACLVYRLGKRD